MSVDLLSSCSNPKIVYNPYLKDYILASCGRCSSCLASRSRFITQLCKQEESSHKYCAFVTLDYNELCIPKALIVDTETNICGRSHRSISLIDVTERPKYRFFHGTKSVVGIDHLPTYCQQICTLDCDSSSPSFKAFFNKSDIPVRNFKKPVYKYIRYSSRYDLQLFLKRVRFQISKISGENLRFFAVSEYGPRSFRPHYHVLFYFSSELTSEILQGICNQCWSYGNSVYSLSQGATANYLAGYLNSSVVLPDFLSVSSFRPFSSHSNFFGKTLFKHLRKDVYSDVSTSLNGHSVTIGSSIFQLYGQSQITRLFFPKTFNFFAQPRANLLTLYTAYFLLKNTWKSDNIRILALSLLSHQSHYLSRSILSCLDIKPYCHSDSYCSSSVPLFVTHSDSYYSDILLGYCVLSDNDMTFYHRIVSALYVSKHFVTFCCGSDYTYNSMLSKIIDYWNLFNYRLLTSQLESQVQYNLNTGSTDYSLFYPLNYRTSDYRSILNSNAFFITRKIAINSLIFSKIKHKQLNNVNVQFTGVLNSFSNG